MDLTALQNAELMAEGYDTDPFVRGFLKGALAAMEELKHRKLDAEPAQAGHAG